MQSDKSNPSLSFFCKVCLVIAILRRLYCLCFVFLQVTLANFKGMITIGFFVLHVASKIEVHSFFNSVFRRNPLPKEKDHKLQDEPKGGSQACDHSKGEAVLDSAKDS